MAKDSKTNDTVQNPAPAPTDTLPPAPAGVSAEVWAAALAAASTKTAKTPRAKSAGIVELTVETAQALVKAGTWAAQVRAGSIGTIHILPTIADGGCYTLAVVNDKGIVTHVEPAHVDRVKSPRHLPRALRLAGTWLGANSADFSNGVKGGKAETKDEQPAPAPAPAPKPTAKAARKTDSKGDKKPSRK